MLRLVLPATLVLALVYGVTGVWRAWVLRAAPRRRTWAVFVGRSPLDRLVVRRVRRADPTAHIAVYRSGHALAARLGVADTPAVVLGDGEGGVRERAIGRPAITALLQSRTWAR